MNTTAPRKAAGELEHIHQIYYGTDDGYARLEPREEKAHDAAHIAGLYEVFSRFEGFYEDVATTRRKQIHLTSVVGGLYGLNLIPIFRPEAMTFFDINPYQILYFEIIKRVWIDSADRAQFLARLAAADYRVESEAEREIQGCLAKRQQGTLTEGEGRSARSLLSSWRYALDHFARTRELLGSVPIETRVEGMQTPSFVDYVAESRNLWLYCSNVMLFAFIDLRFRYPENAAVFATYFDETEMLDLGANGPDPLTLHCHLPMSVTR